MTRCFGVLVLALAVVLSGVPATRVVAQSNELIRVGAGPDDPSTPVIYADQAGLFKRAGLNVQVVKLAGAAVIAAALAGGSLEIGKASSLPVITAYAKGLPFTVIGSIALWTPDHHDEAMVVPANSPIKSASDFAGKTLAAISVSDIGSIATYAWVDQHGVDWHTLKFLEIPASAVVPALGDGRIDGDHLYEPYLSAALAAGKVRIVGYPFDAIARQFTEVVLFANTGWVKEHGELVARFLRVMREASSYVGTHETEVLPLIAQFTGADATAVASMRHAARSVVINPSELQPVIDVAAKYGAIPKSFPAQEIICSCALRR